MRALSTLLILLLTLSAYGQTKDHRAVLEAYGASELSVSPDEKIWLVTSYGTTFYTNSIDSIWHYGKPLPNVDDEYFYNGPQLERISFFNKDTAIITGYISTKQGSAVKNGYYQTKDGGKSWELKDYGKSSWIYCIYNDKKGNAWMGGLNQELYYSNTYGDRWKTIKLPYKHSDRTYSVYMYSDESGIAGSDENEIITTTDNWKTVSYIATPYDQEKYSFNKEPSYLDGRINKIVKWNNFMVVRQDGHIFYTDNQNIAWKSFPIELTDFEINPADNKLFAVTEGLKIVYFSSPTEYLTLSHQLLPEEPQDLKVVNNSLFVLCVGNEVYKVNNKDFIYAAPYTTDRKIKDPEVVRQGKTLTWGLDVNHIYLSDNGSKDWYREDILDIEARDFYIVSDSVIIISDHYNNNYLYSLQDHTTRHYYPEVPLQSFLKYPLKSFTIESGTQGCYHYWKNEVHYKKLHDSIFTCVSYNNERDEHPKTFHQKANVNSLHAILDSINKNPYTIPSIKDFNITEKDKKHYFTLVDDLIKENERDRITRMEIDKEFYYAVPDMLDTMNNSVLKQIATLHKNYGSTTSYWFFIELVNENNDTIYFSNSYHIRPLPWQLPWTFSYNGLNFNCYNPELSKFINACLPDKFLGKEAFDNKMLIKDIADYLYIKERE